MTTNQQSQHQIRALIDSYKTYWQLRGVKQEKIGEMKMEMRYHLEQAVTDGKSLESVVGYNPVGLARSWAHETQPRLLRSSPLILHGLVFVLSVVSTTAFIHHLLIRQDSSSFLNFLWGSFNIAAGLLAIRLTDKRASEENEDPKAWLLPYGAGCLFWSLFGVIYSWFSESRPFPGAGLHIPEQQKVTPDIRDRSGC